MYDHFTWTIQCHDRKDISGLEEAKQSLLERIMWPDDHPDVYKNVPVSKVRYMHNDAYVLLHDSKPYYI